MKKNNKGFTLVELLAVIVILGLLMAIAIPSVTKYITESRKKTVISSINSYVSAVITQVNDGQYRFSDSNKIFAIPIECIPLEKGGTNPFGNWMQANKSYWAYVLVHYDSENYNYEYGFTFKDDAGYGLYPTTQEKLETNQNQIKTGLDLEKPSTGYVFDVTSLDNWNGFDIDEETNLIVLDSETEGKEGNGRTTCTLYKKGNNYDDVENKKAGKLVDLILKNNTIITDKPTLTTSSNNTSDASGLYISTDTNNGEPTYYFRGKVSNNYVKFAGFTWKIIRINENGTIRMIMDGNIGSTTYQSVYNSYEKMYYSNGSLVKTKADNWYKNNIIDKGYDSYVATSMFCEQARVKYLSRFASGNASTVEYSIYTPTFKCETDGNGKGILYSKIGLINYDEVIYAGGYYGKGNNFYLQGKSGGWMMSPDCVVTNARVWAFDGGGIVHGSNVEVTEILSPVINLKADVSVTGLGTSSKPYVVQTN